MFGADEGLVEDEVGLLEAGLEIAERPLVGVLAERQLAVAGRGEVLVGPLQLLHLRPGGAAGAAPAAGRRRRGRTQTLPSRARVRAARPQALERIDDERQRLELDLDRLDRFGRGELVDGRDREDRLALVERLVGQAALAERAGDDAFAEVGAVDDGRQIVGGEDRLDAGHRQRRAACRCRGRAHAASG